MTYDSLKILHIVDAGLLISGLGYSFHLWYYMQAARDMAVRAARIQTLTWLVIFPLAIIQLLTGGFMISLKHEDLSQFWISASISGFILLIASWFAFIYFLLLSQQVTVRKNIARLSYRRAQSFMLLCCALALLVMVFFMSNKMA